MTVKVEFFFDLSSPWTRLAFHNVQPIIEVTGAEIIWRPILVGGVFNAVNQAVYASREDMTGPKARHYAKSLKDWAAAAGVSMHFPSPWHPVRSVHAMRACTALADDQPALQRFAKACFDAYFGPDQRNLDDPNVLSAIASGLGMDGPTLISETRDQAVKDRLCATTEEVIARGGYGSPTIFVDTDDMYFGNDQLPLVERAIRLKSE
ncbi:MAG: 2-hydroxychromene-2-carboxylate isomerase [Pseudomonadota bacterium]